MRNITLEELLEAGCHFGHQVQRQNSKARDFIFEARDGIHIIDLEKTKEGLEDAGKFVYDLAKKGGTLLVLGTKKQAQGVLQEESKKASDAGATGLYYVTQRWIGGTLTNFSEVAKNYKKLKDITTRLKDDYAKQGYTKKEIGDWDKTRQKLEGFYGGTQDMDKVPDAIFVVDSHFEDVAVKEALRKGVPTVGITDTNSDPTIVTYPIPSNDDAVGALKIVVGYIFDAWIEGRKEMGKEAEKAAAVVAKEAAREEKKAVKEAKGTEETKVTDETEVKKEEKSAKKTTVKKKTAKKEESK